MSSLSSTIAEQLLDIEAVKITPNTPFRWSSGWNSPIYCDNRLVLSYPLIRSLIKDGLVNIYREHDQADIIAGVATAGIPMGMLVAEALELPFIYVRSTAKAHGMKNQIEGRAPAGKKVVVVEDLISTGGSSLAAVEALRDAGANIAYVMAIFQYGFVQADQAFDEAEVPKYTLLNIEDILKVADHESRISASDREAIRRWQASPDTWRGQVL